MDFKGWWHETREGLKTLKPVGVSFSVLLLGGFIGCLIATRHSLRIGLLLGLVVGAFFGPVFGAGLPYVKRFKIPEEKQLEGVQLYLEGKMKRYWLLFAVNGGAYAIANLSKERPVLWDPALSVGAILFTVIMTADIWLWGADMRQKLRPEALVFGPIGQTILLIIGGLIAAGWTLFGPPLINCC